MPVATERKRWIPLRDATPEALADELARREQAEREAKARREQEAKDAAKRRKDVLAAVPPRLDELRRELDAALTEAADTGRPSPRVRAVARMALLGGAGADEPPFRQLAALGSDTEPLDRPVAAVHGVMLRAGRLLVDLERAGAADSDEAERVDVFECGAWSALYRRVVFLAGLDIGPKR